MEAITVAMSTGASVPMRPFTTKAGTQSFGILKSTPKGYVKSSSVKIKSSVVGGSFAQHVTVLGVKIAGTVGVTERKVHPKTGRITTPAGLPKVTYFGHVKVNGEPRQFLLWMHDLGGDVYRIAGGVTRPLEARAAAEPATSL